MLMREDMGVETLGVGWSRSKVSVRGRGYPWESGHKGVMAYSSHADRIAADIDLSLVSLMILIRFIQTLSFTINYDYTIDTLGDNLPPGAVGPEGLG